MNQSSLKNATIVLVAGVFLASGYALKKIMQSTPVRQDAQELSYEMPRARTEAPGYSLAGRRVIRTLHTAGGRGQNVPPAQAVLPAATKPADPKKAAAAAKKPDPKKTAKANSANRKPKMTVGVTEANKVRMSGFKVTANSSNPDPAMTGFANAEKTANPVAAAPIEEEKTKLSIGQWRSLLFNQPTAKHGSEFLAAYQDREVDEAGFYQVTEELMIDNAPDRHKLGMDLLKATPSVKAFTVLLKHHNEKAPEALRTEITAVLKTYGEVSRFPILVKLLYSSELRVVQTAQALLTQTIASMQTNGSQGAQDGRDARAPATPVPASQLTSFVPALKRLLTSNDAVVAQQAQTLLDSIQSLRPA
jgi:hypothetical protein